MAQLPSLRIPDVLDGKLGSGLAAWLFSNVRVVDSINSSAHYSTIAGMISDISAGQAAWLNAETFSESTTISKAITVQGTGPAETLITKDDAFIVVSISAAAYIADLRVENVRSGSGALNAYAIDISGNDTVLRNVEAECNPPDATSGNCYGIRSNATGVRLEHCRAEANQANQTQHGLHVASGDVTVIGGYYSGAQADIYVASGATAYLEGPRLAAGGLVNNGDVTGYYIDDSTEEIVIVGMGLGVGTGSPETILHLLRQGSASSTLGGAPSVLTLEMSGGNSWSGGEAATEIIFKKDGDIVGAIRSEHTREGGPHTFEDAGLTFYVAPIAETPTPFEAMRLTHDGDLGVGTQSPQSRVHMYGTISGALQWEYDGLDGTTRTIIPNGSEDVNYYSHITYLVRDANGAAAGGTMTLAPGGSGNVNTGNITVQFRVQADGTMDVRRISGGISSKVAVWVLYM